MYIVSGIVGSLIGFLGFGSYEPNRVTANDAQRNEPPVAGTPSKPIVSTV